MQREAQVDRIPKPCLHKHAQHEHGTLACYVLDKCRCLPCASANSTAESERQRQKAYGRYNSDATAKHDPQRSVHMRDVTEHVLPIDDSLRRAILERIGRPTGAVTVTEETYGLGFCDTCSYVLDGFAVKVDGEIVWPSDEHLAAEGGCIYLDEEGRVDGGTLTTWGHFFDWLHARP